MRHPISGCCFVKDALTGAFCVFESMATILPLVDEYVVMDLGSTDGTLEALREVADANPRVRLVRGGWPEVDAGAFATLANDLMRECRHDVCWYHQADEVWHEDLLHLVDRRLKIGAYDMSFWRIQYRDNFQRVKWFPHVVHRIGWRGPRFRFVGDGMNTSRYMEPPMCAAEDKDWFPRWGGLGQEGIKPYVNHMVLDVSLVGGFRDNVVERRRLHAPFWHEEPTVEGVPAGEWQTRAEANPDWTRTTSPYDLPAIMRGLVGMTRYELRDSVRDALLGDRPWREGWR